MCVSLVTSVVSDALQPCGLWPARLLCPWDPPDKNTGVGCRVIIQGNLPNPGAEPGLLQMDSLLLSQQGSSQPLNIHL